MAHLPTTAPAEKVVCGGGRAPLAEGNARSVAFFDADLTPPQLTFVRLRFLAGFSPAEPG